MEIVPRLDQIISEHWTNNKIYFRYADGSELVFPQDQIMIKLGGELNNTNGGTLTVGYFAPFHVVEGMELTFLANPVFEARLEGSTLHLHYSYDKNVRAILIPIWSFMTQFDYFAGRDLVSDYWYSAYSDRSARVVIEVS
jgi:hypothetical protein